MATIDDERYKDKKGAERAVEAVEVEAMKQARG